MGRSRDRKTEMINRGVREMEKSGGGGGGVRRRKRKEGGAGKRRKDKQTRESLFTIFII